MTIKEGVMAAAAQLAMYLPNFGEVLFSFSESSTPSNFWQGPET